MNKIPMYDCSRCKGCKQPIEDPKWGTVRDTEYFIYSKNSYGHHSGVPIPISCYCSTKCLKKDFFLKKTRVRKKFLFFKYNKLYFRWTFKKNPKKRYIVKKNK